MVSLSECVVVISVSGSDSVRVNSVDGRGISMLVVVRMTVGRNLMRCVGWVWGGAVTVLAQALCGICCGVVGV